MKIDKMYIFKIFLQLLLLGIFFYYFGYPSLLKYQEHKTLVLSSELRTGGIPAPDITICARNDHTRKWSTNTSLDSVLNSCSQNENIFVCVEENVLNFNKVIIDAWRGTELMENLMDHSLWTSYTFDTFLTCYTLKPNKTIGTDHKIDRLKFLLNESFTYRIHIHSQDYFIMHFNPMLMHYDIQFVAPPHDCESYISIALEEHHEFNHPLDPCITHQEYSFWTCIQESVSREVGCRPRDSMQAGPICKTEHQYR